MKTLARLGLAVALLTPSGCGGGGGGGDDGGGFTPPPPTPVTFTPGTTAVPTPTPFAIAPFVLVDVAFTTLGDDDAVPDLFYASTGTTAGGLYHSQDSLQGYSDATYSGGYGGSGWGPGVRSIADAGDVIGPGLGGGVYILETSTLMYVVTWGVHFEGLNRSQVGGVDTVSSGHATALVTGDWDGDGIDDVAIADGPAAAVHTYLSLGATGLAPLVTTPLPVGSNPNTMTAIDFDGDGDDDIVLGDVAGGLRALRSNGDGTFAVVANPGSLGGAARRIELLASGRFDADATLDLGGVIEEGGTRRLFTMRGDGDGTFSLPVFTTLSGSAATAAGARIRAADFNLDGNTDVAFVVPSAAEVHVCLGDGFASLIENADADFAGAGPCDALSIGDLDGDGDVDLGVVDAAGFVVRVLLNDTL
jgi:hypothetical protein